MALILIVDDDVLIRTVLQFTLAEQGYEVAEAPDGASALQVLRERPVGLVILDAHMPGLGLAEILTGIAALEMRPVVVVLSGDLEPPAALSATSLWTRYLTKPVDREVLLAEVGAALSASAGPASGRGPGPSHGSGPDQPAGPGNEGADRGA